jgi:hypothetical protein
VAIIIGKKQHNMKNRFFKGVQGFPEDYRSGEIKFLLQC